jgi:hypothetical protein
MPFLSTEEVQRRLHARKLKLPPRTRPEPETEAETEPGAAAPEPDVPRPAREHPVPEDSILHHYCLFAQTVTEAPDCWIVAPVLALCGKLLTPEVSIDFAGTKPLTLFNFMAGPAGLRKSTTFAPALAIAQRVLNGDEQHEGNASDSALFDVFAEQPHRLQFEDEGNTILSTWSKSHHGQEVSARYLKLYDGASWRQTFRRAVTKEDEGAARAIDRATLSLCIGSTYGVSRFTGIDAASGLRRRFGYYVANGCARKLYWPASLDHGELDHHANQFRKLRELKHVYHRGSFSDAGWKAWCGIQDRNRARVADIRGFTAAEETLSASLNESAMRILKLSIIFQACRWAAGSIPNPSTLTDEVLLTAEAHQNACLDALTELDTCGRRSEIDDTAMAVHAQITATHPSGNEVLMTKSELTMKFASNPGRFGAICCSRLYGEIIPQLMALGIARIAEKAGKKVTYAFLVE